MPDWQDFEAVDEPQTNQATQTDWSGFESADEKPPESPSFLSRIGSGIRDLAISAGKALIPPGSQPGIAFRGPQQPPETDAGMQVSPADKPLMTGGNVLASLLGQGAQAAGGALKDIAGAYAFEAIGEPELQAKQLGIDNETLQKAGLTPQEPDSEQKPLEEGMHRLPAAARFAAEVPYSLIQTAPQIAAVAGAQAAGVPAPLGAAAVFGSTEKGFDPKSAAVAAFLPFAGKYSGRMVSKLAEMAGVSSEQALALFNKLGGVSGAAAILGGVNEADIQKLPPEQRGEARLNAWANIAGQSLLGLTESDTQVERVAGKLGEAVKSTELPETEPKPVVEPGERPPAPGVTDLEFKEKTAPETSTEEKPATPDQTKETTYARQDTKNEEVHGPLSEQPVKGPEAVPTQNGSSGVRPDATGQKGQVSLSAELTSDLANRVRGALSEDATKGVSSVDSMIQRLQDPNAKIDNSHSAAAGLSVNSIADLNKLADAKARISEVRTRVKEAEAKGKVSEDLMREYVSAMTRTQYPREAIETATNTGSWEEGGQGAARVQLGTRPMDWRTHPEVADWLAKNGEKLGISLPDELKGLAQGGAQEAPTEPSQAVPGINPARAMAEGRGGETGAIRLPGAQKMRENLKKLDRNRRAFGTIFNARPTRHAMDQLIDAADNMANIAGRQAGVEVRTGADPGLDRAASAVIASGFDRTKLPELMRKAVAGDNKDAQAAVRAAMNRWTDAVDVANRGKALLDQQQQREVAKGINTDYHKDYLPGVYDRDLLIGTDRPFVIAGTAGGGLASGFKKGKTYDTPFDAIADGYKPKSLKLSDLVEHRVKVGERMVNRLAWGDALKGFHDPTDNKPLVTDLTTVKRPDGRTEIKTPPGYVYKEIMPGVRVGVHEVYEKLFDALTGRSAVEQFEPGGVPVGKLALQAAGGLKHGMLLFDTFHASRVLQRALFLKGLSSYEGLYGKGHSLLEYNEKSLSAALSNGEITRETADWVRANRPTAQLLISNGLNVGRIQESLYNSAVQNLPFIGKFNKWVFEKVTRGAMLEGALHEYDRLSKSNPNMPPAELARKVARDINVYFGNLGRQGVFKSKTFQDAARLTWLAPQWAESMLRAEVGGVKQMTIDPVMKRKLEVGTLGAGMAKGLLGYFVASQVLNLITRHQFTWKNEERGHKLDAWIPDISGKTGGYFISPLSVMAEYTHDMMKYIHTEPDSMAAATRIASNKTSPMWKAGRAISGRDWNDQEIVGNWNKVKTAAIDLIPTPLPAQPAVRPLIASILNQPYKSKPLAALMERQAMQSAGVPVDPADTEAARGVRQVRIIDALARQARQVEKSERKDWVRKHIQEFDFDEQETKRALSRMQREGVFTRE